MIDTTFRRVRMLQPDVTEEYFHDDVQPVTDSQAFHDLRIAISCWDPPREHFSRFFIDEFTIQKIVRQIVTAVVVKTQKVRCQIEHQAVPYDDGAIFDDPLPDSLRALTESEFELNFPLSPIVERERLFAAESIFSCETCDGAGQIECAGCSGVGTKPCENCSGAGEVQCASCDGTGETMLTATQTRPCDTCQGNGVAGCGNCGGEGVALCHECISGVVACQTCDTKGMMRNQTFLVKETYLQVKHRLYCKNGWVDPASELATDLAIHRYQSFTGSGAEIKPEMLRQAVPEYLRQDAARLSQSMAAASTNTTWDLGTRFELRAGYVYHAVVEHLERRSELFVSGCSNIVTLYKAAEQPKSFRKRLARSISGFVENPGAGGHSTNRDHIAALRAGEAFLSDVRLVGPELRNCGLDVHVSPDGYDVTIQNAPAGFNEANVNFNYDAAGNIILHSSVLLGEADRDCFADALSLCNKLPVGQIALQALNGGVLERFSLVNRQMYMTTSAPHLAYLLRQLVSTAYEIRKSNRIGLSL